MALIKGNQIAAARALLGWDQKDVAERVGLSVAAISKIEKGDNVGRAGTLENIEKAFDAAGLEFTSGEGVKKKEQAFITFQGVEGFAKFYDDIYQTAKVFGGEFCVNNVDEETFDKWHGSEERLQFHLDRMAKVIKGNPKFKMRIITREGDPNVRATKYAQYKWAKNENFSDVPFYVYGDKLAVLIFEEDEAYICVIPNKKVADAYRKQFDVSWRLAYEPDTE